MPVPKRPFVRDHCRSSQRAPACAQVRVVFQSIASIFGDSLVGQSSQFPPVISQGFCVLHCPAAFCAHYSSDGRDRGIRKCFFITRGKKIWGDAAETDGQTDTQKDKTASGKKWDWTRFASRQFASWCDAGILDSNLASRKSKPPWGALPSKKLEALLRSLANCTFLWLLLVAQPPAGDATLSQKASSHLPHAHSQTPRSVARWPPPFALRGIRPSACLGMGLDANGTAHIRACLAKRFLKLEGEDWRPSPKSHVFITGSRGRGISRCEVDKWSAPLIEPFGQATRTFIASAEWAGFLRNGRLGASALFLRQKVLVLSASMLVGREGREISRVSPTFVKTAERGQKTRFPHRRR